MQRRGSTLVWGTANPEGLKDTYRGVYLNAGDVSSMVEQVIAANTRGASIPVKLEHSGVSLGRVVSAWENQGTLQCVLEIDEGVLEGSIGAEFVRTGVCKDLSLADAYLVPQVESSRRFKVDLTPYPLIRAIDKACAELDAFARAAPGAQPDAA